MKSARALVILSLVILIVLPAAAQAKLKWINKDLTNSLPGKQNAEDVDVYFTGHIASDIVLFYDDNSPRVTHQTPVETTIVTPSGIALKVTIVKWVGTIPNGSTVHVGVLVDEQSPGSFYQAYWTDKNGGKIGKVAGCADVDLVSNGSDVTVVVQSPLDEPGVVIHSLAYSVTDHQFPLEELTWNNPAMIWEPVGGTLTLDPGEEQAVATISGVVPGQFVQFELAVQFVGESLDTSGHVIVQSEHTP